MEVTIATSKSTGRGVAVVSISSKLSRVYDWNVETGEFTPGQFVRASAYAIDVSQDGKHFTYGAVAHHKREQCYVAVAHIPFFTALAFFPTLHVTYRTAFFRDHESLVVHANRHEHPWVENYDQIQERIEPHCPYQILRDEPNDYSLLHFKGKYVAIHYIQERRFVAHRDTIYDVSYSVAEPTPIRTFEDEPFEEIATPDWATIW